MGSDDLGVDLRAFWQWSASDLLSNTTRGRIAEFLPIDQDVADIAARFRRDRRWRLPDADQAAVATHDDLYLATRNTRDFDPDRDRFVAIPHRL